MGSSYALPDSRMEMPALFERGRKPVGSVKIDNNSIYPTPSAFIISDELVIKDMLSTRFANRNGSVTTKGSGVKFTDSGDNYYIFDDSNLDGVLAATATESARPMTWIADVMPNEATGISRIFAVTSTDTTTELSLIMVIRDLKIDIFIYNESGIVGERLRAISISAELTLNQRSIITFTYDGSSSHTGITLYVDGREVAATKTTDVVFTAPNYSSNHRAMIAGFLPGHSLKDFSNLTFYSFQAYANLEMTAEQVFDISKNPYRILIPS